MLCTRVWRSGVLDGTGWGSESTEKVGVGALGGSCLHHVPREASGKELGFDLVVPAGGLPVIQCQHYSEFGIHATRSPPSATTAAPLALGPLAARSAVQGVALGPAAPTPTHPSLLSLP